MNWSWSSCLPEGGATTTFNHIPLDAFYKTVFERDCLPKLTKQKELIAFKHNGFWGCMDTLREKKELNKIYKSKEKAWKVWM